MTKQEAMQKMAEQLKIAQQALEEAREIALEAGVEYTFEASMQDLYEEVTESYVDWNASNC